MYENSELFRYFTLWFGFKVDSASYSPRTVPGYVNSYSDLDNSPEIYSYNESSFLITSYLIIWSEAGSHPWDFHGFWQMIQLENTSGYLLQ